MVKQLTRRHRAGGRGRVYLNMMIGKHLSEEVTVGERFEGRREPGC